MLAKASLTTQLQYTSLATDLQKGEKNTLEKPTKRLTTRQEIKAAKLNVYSKRQLCQAAANLLSSASEQVSPPASTVLASDPLE